MVDIEKCQNVFQIPKCHLGQELYQFSLGLVAGVTGAVFVYPIDSVKTGVQNQRSAIQNESIKPELIYNFFS